VCGGGGGGTGGWGGWVGGGGDTERSRQAEKKEQGGEIREQQGKQTAAGVGLDGVAVSLRVWWKVPGLKELGSAMTDMSSIAPITHTPSSPVHPHSFLAAHPKSAPPPPTHTHTR